jgi:hypothetical protein
MTLVVPNYIRSAVDPSVPISFEWDDSDPESHFVFDDARLARRIAADGAGTARGIAALSIGCTEWIVYRFSTMSSDPMPRSYVEAAWAGLIDWNYMKLKPEAKLKDWKGPVQRPLFVAIRTLHENLRMAMNGDFPAEETVHLVFLARYVLPEPKPFLKWLDFAIERVAKYYSTDGMGEPVPREVLDPDFDFKPEQANELLARYLKGLSPAENPYLQLPVPPSP